MTIDRSIRARLLAGSLLWLGVLLPLSAFVLISTFYSHTRDRLDALLADHIHDLTESVAVDESGDTFMRWTPADSHYDKTLSGWYWQISRGGKIRHRSPSLSGHELPTSAPDSSRNGAEFEMVGPGGHALRVLVNRMTEGSSSETISFVATAPTSEIEVKVREFTWLTSATFALLGIGLVMLVALQVSIGLRPLDEMGRALVAVRNGSRSKMPEDFPLEIQQLSVEINKLLRHNAELVSRAREHSGNMAHSLKNPLTVIVNEAAAVTGTSGEIIRVQAERMQGDIEHFLRQIRIAGASPAPGTRVEVASIVEDLRFMLERLHQERRITFDIDISGECLFNGDAEDLEEVLGNVMDNACKWARSLVRVRCDQDQEEVRIVVEDDGPGIATDDRNMTFERGTRLDHGIPGHGLGLFIAKDIVSVYKGTITLDRSTMGGLRVDIRLPKSNASPDDTGQEVPT